MFDFFFVLKAFIIPGVAAFLFSFLLTPLTATAAVSLGAIDKPDGVRKINTRPTPRLGGLGFFAAFSLTSLLFLPFGDRTVAAILVSGGIVIAFGVADDIKGLSPPVKLAAQALAASTAVLILGPPTSFSLFGLGTAALSPVIGIIFGIVRITFTANAVNFSDGLDGLAAGLSVVACLAIGLFALKNGRTEAAACAFILAMGIFGFLPYNKYHAHVFMGDSGSQFLGIAISILALRSTADGGLNLATSLFLFLPIADTWLSVIRRLLSAKSPFAADKGHIHHLLLSLGLSHPAAVKILVSLSALIAVITLFFI